MAAELLQLLSAAKSMNDQASINQTINQHADAINSHARAIDQQAVTLASIEARINTISQAHAGTQDVGFFLLVGLVLAISILGALWIDRLNKRIKALESLREPSLAAK